SYFAAAGRYQMPGGVKAAVIIIGGDLGYSYVVIHAVKEHQGHMPFLQLVQVIMILGLTGSGHDNAIHPAVGHIVNKGHFFPVFIIGHVDEGMIALFAGYLLNTTYGL